jgi:hypothetical protein
MKIISTGVLAGGHKEKSTPQDKSKFDRLKEILSGQKWSFYLAT